MLEVVGIVWGCSPLSKIGFFMGKPRTFKGEIATFRRVAKQRFLSAEYLERGGYNLDAIYLAGYSVECILERVSLYPLIP